jgi:hypothetical protein
VSDPAHAIEVDLRFGEPAGHFERFGASLNHAAE